jgi:hypothetical protein
LIVGIQMLLQAVGQDIQNVPSKVIGVAVESTNVQDLLEKSVSACEQAGSTQTAPAKYQQHP